VLFMAVSASGFYLYEIDRSVTANITRGLDLPPETSSAGVARPQKDPDAGKALNYVLIGKDGGDRALDESGPSDAIMLLHLNAARDRAYVISIPRDTEVSLPGHEEKTMNYAFSLGGAPLVVETVEQLTDVRVDHVAMIDFRGFVSLTEDLGGVSVRNATPFAAGGHTFNKGNITLQGDAALAFVREHRQIGEAGRAENQRNMLKAILAKGLSADVITDPLRFTRFVGNAAKNVQVDNDLSDSELRSMAVSLRLKPDNITLLSVPLEAGRPTSAKPYRPVRKEQFEQFTSALRSDTMNDYVEKHGNG
jgi:polyisoprenyl-teichoic acid--peptidoglycan teichoic acid transferase